jgi:hypothetical protein
MLKPISVIIGCLTIFAMAPGADAMMANSQPAAIEPAATNLHTQVILKIGDRDRRYNRDRGYSRGGIRQQRRNLEQQRDREADRQRDRDGDRQRDREADRRRDRDGDRRDNPNDGYYRRDP